MIQVDLDSPKPLEEQIVGGLRQAIARGSIVPGADLPSVRQLADDLGVHWNTVARAYRRLGDEGVLVVRRGRGAVVNVEHRAILRMTKTSVRERLTEAIAAGLVGGLSHNDLADLFAKALAHFDERKGRS